MGLFKRKLFWKRTVSARAQDNEEVDMGALVDTNDCRHVSEDDSTQYTNPQQLGGIISNKFLVRSESAVSTGSSTSDGVNLDELTSDAGTYDQSLLSYDEMSYESFQGTIEKNGEYPLEKPIIVEVPPGKTGLVIGDDNPLEPPFIHQIKEYVSPPVLKSKVQVGDKLVRIDEKDVTYYTALQVSHLLSKRSDKVRRMTFIRTVFAGTNR